METSRASGVPSWLNGCNALFLFDYFEKGGEGAEIDITLLYYE
jgi:hypothetical protein